MMSRGLASLPHGSLAAMLLLALLAISGWARPLGAQEPTPVPPAVEATAATPATSKGKEHTLSLSIDTDDEALPKDVRERLTTEQLYQIELAKTSRMVSPESWKQILVPLAFFAMIVGIVGLSFWARARRQRLLHETVRMMVEKGQPLPPGIFQETTPRIKSDLRRGLVWMAVGIGLVAHFAADQDSTWGLGLIPFFIGIGYLIAWKLERPTPPNQTL